MQKLLNNIKYLLSDYHKALTKLYHEFSNIFFSSTWRMPACVDFQDLCCTTQPDSQSFLRGASPHDVWSHDGYIIKSY